MCCARPASLVMKGPDPGGGEGEPGLQSDASEVLSPRGSGGGSPGPVSLRVDISENPHEFHCTVIGAFG